MDFDLLIRGGTVIDGTAAAQARVADVGVAAGRIAAVGRLEGSGAGRVIEANGRIVCPGFIDPHSHAEVALLGGAFRNANLLQGVTTLMTAPDGFGWAPLSRRQAEALWSSTLFAYGRQAAANLSFEWPTPAAYLTEFSGRTPLNVVPMVPHLAVRFGVMGWAPRTATAAELELMRVATRDWMEAGAVGLNVGLDYQPSVWSDTDELVELAKVAAEFGGVYSAHQRYTVHGWPAATRETIDVGRRAALPVNISHAYLDDGFVELLEAAVGVADVAFETYLYPAGSTHLIYDVPLVDQVGGPDALRERVRDPSTCQRIAGILAATFETAAIGGARPYFAATRTGRFVGKTIGQAAAELEMSTVDFLGLLLREELPDAILVYHRGLSDEQFEPIVRRTVSHARVMIASDGVAHGEQPHPRGAGCFARILGYCVRELRAIGLEDAIHRMSGFTAARYGVTDRGRIMSGLAADLVVFDPSVVADRATWEEPTLEPVGIDAVIVNGVVAAEAGRATGALPGRVLRPLLD